MAPDDVVLRPAVMSDADGIGRVMRAALGAFDWMPMIPTPEDRAGPRRLDGVASRAICRHVR